MTVLSLGWILIVKQVLVYSDDCKVAVMTAFRKQFIVGEQFWLGSSEVVIWQSQFFHTRYVLICLQ